MKEIKISFHASVDKDELEEARRKFWTDGASVISSEFPMLENVCCFSVEEDPLEDEDN